MESKYNPPMVGRTDVVSAMLVVALLVGGCGSAHNTLDVKGLHIGISERAFLDSPDTFKFFEAGHFGNKVQYNAVSPDEYGGAYAVHLIDGIARGIEVKYEKALSRQQALGVASRLMPGVAVDAPTEHDDDDVKLHDAKRACEFFYYQKNLRAELLYVPGSTSEVNQINIWSK